MATASNLAYRDEPETPREEAVRKAAEKRAVATDRVYWGEAANEPTFNRDATRGIENIVVRGRDGVPYDTEERVGPVEKEFLEEKGLAARAYKQKDKRAEREAIEAANEETLYLEEAARELAVREAKALVAQKIARKEAMFSAGLRSGKKVASFARWMSLGGIWTVYLWQFLFAMGTLLGFGIAAYLLYLKEGTFTGKVLSYFVNFDSLVPARELGFIFWGLGALLSIGAFVIYLIWFYMLGLSVLRSTMLFFLTLLALVLSILPILNLFPWLPLWVIYMNASALFNSE
jgi:hypothetical protein